VIADDAPTFANMVSEVAMPAQGFATGTDAWNRRFVTNIVRNIAEHQSLHHMNDAIQDQRQIESFALTCAVGKT
jgi:predicted regulator of amino acid metabolism with ACT domain